jgi:hypothetical protein
VIEGKELQFSSRYCRLSNIHLKGINMFLFTRSCSEEDKNLFYCATDRVPVPTGLPYECPSNLRSTNIMSTLDSLAPELIQKIGTEVCMFQPLLTYISNLFIDSFLSLVGEQCYRIAPRLQEDEQRTRITHSPIDCHRYYKTSTGCWHITTHDAGDAG